MPKNYWFYFKFPSKEKNYQKKEGINFFIKILRELVKGKRGGHRHLGVGFFFFPLLSWEFLKKFGKIFRQKFWESGGGETYQVICARFKGWGQKKWFFFFPASFCFSGRENLFFSFKRGWGPRMRKGLDWRVRGVGGSIIFFLARGPVGPRGNSKNIKKKTTPIWDSGDF